MNKEETGRLVLEASTGMHGEVARILAEEWAKVAGENERLTGVVEEVNSWIVCAAIASPADMMQSAPRIEQITRRIE